MKQYADLHLRMTPEDRATLTDLSRAVITNQAGQRGATLTPLVRGLCQAFRDRPDVVISLLRQAMEANDVQTDTVQSRPGADRGTGG